MASQESHSRPSEVGQQGEFKIDIPKELSREELATKASVVLNQYVERVLPILYPMASSGGGKEELGAVPGRPGEQQLLIDAVGQERLTNTIRENDCPARILGEHNETSLSNGREDFVFFAQDPFDNTSQHRRDLPTSVFSVVSAYHRDGTPIGGVIIDIKAKKTYMSINGKNTLITYDLVEEADEKTNEKRIKTKVVKTEEVTRSERKTLNDPNATMASFLGEKEYFLPASQNFSHLIATGFQRKTMLYPEGGAFVYGLLEAGKIDAYAMFKEPRTEIDPGFAVAKLAGCTIVSVNPEDGTFEDYVFDPSKNKDDVAFFIAAATPEIRDEIIRYYLESKGETQRKQEENALKDTFIDRNRAAFDIFVSEQISP